jgi:transcriptional regulator with XRE-family HTH domain
MVTYNNYRIEGGMEPDRLPEIATAVAGAFKSRRIEMNITQEELSRRSGVSFGSVKRFESKHEISMKHLIQLAVVLKLADRLLTVFTEQLTKDDGVVQEPEPVYRRRTGKKRIIRFEVPGDLEFEDHDLEMIIASKLYETGRLSAGHAATLAGLSKRTFIELLGKQGVSVFSTSIDDLRNDIANA